MAVGRPSTLSFRFLEREPDSFLKVGKFLLSVLYQPFIPYLCSVRISHKGHPSRFINFVIVSDMEKKIVPSFKLKAYVTEVLRAKGGSVSLPIGVEIPCFKTDEEANEWLRQHDKAASAIEEALRSTPAYSIELDGESLDYLVIRAFLQEDRIMTLQVFEGDNGLRCFFQEGCLDGDLTGLFDILGIEQREMAVAYWDNEGVSPSVMNLDGSRFDFQPIESLSCTVEEAHAKVGAALGRNLMTVLLMRYYEPYIKRWLRLAYTMEELEVIERDERYYYAFGIDKGEEGTETLFTAGTLYDLLASCAKESRIMEVGLNKCFVDGWRMTEDGDSEPVYTGFLEA